MSKIITQAEGDKVLKYVTAKSEKKVDTSKNVKKENVMVQKADYLMTW